MEVCEKFSIFIYNLSWKTLMSECNIPFKIEIKEGVGEKSEEKKARKNANERGGVNNGRKMG
jgi:hypothetical protein